MAMNFRIRSGSHLVLFKCKGASEKLFAHKLSARIAFYLVHFIRIETAGRDNLFPDVYKKSFENIKN